MQTFLPYPDFRESARVLDPRRLGNQFYREGLTLLRGKWANHPAARMWRGHHYALGCYLLACERELARRGHHYPEHGKEVLNRILWALARGETMDPPAWLGDPDFHARHRAALLAKDPEWYGRFGWTEEPSIDYIWPEPNSQEEKA